MEKQDVIQDAVDLLKRLREDHIEKPYEVIYASLYVAMRVISTEEPEILQEFLDWLVKFIKEVLDKDNIGVH